ncbi:MAG: Type 1 glutamine amidotransferase-like domain-containing protein [Anaerolineae bacterium]|nr:Type 1 glutamine amidotransferase-like domain-containing protein [Anaerolineae bacterium]
MKGYLILNGGEAFTPRTKLLDHSWLSLIRGQSRPRLMVVPVASVDKPFKAADEAAHYFKNLATFAEYTLITDQLTANTAQHVEPLDKVDVICFTDGSPVDMVERLRGTKTEAALHRALARKACVMGTGASAMALGGAFWLSGAWETGLGLAPHLAILPHHQIVQMRLPPERLLAELPPGITVIGIDDATALIGYPDDTYQAEGEGHVTVYRSVEQQDSYRAGDRFSLASQ